MKSVGNALRVAPRKVPSSTNHCLTFMFPSASPEHPTALAESSSGQHPKLTSKPPAGRRDCRLNSRAHCLLATDRAAAWTGPLLQSSGRYTLLGSGLPGDPRLATRHNSLGLTHAKTSS